MASERETIQALRTELEIVTRNVKALTKERDEALARVDEAKRDGEAEGVMHAAEYLESLIKVLRAGDEGHGHVEHEIAILEWAQKKVGSL